MPRMALRVLRPKSPHSEGIAQYIEWRDPCGHAAVWLKGSAVQGRHDRLIGDIDNKSGYILQAGSVEYQSLPACGIF